MNTLNYESPAVEIYDLELENAILQSSGEDMEPMDFGW